MNIQFKTLTIETFDENLNGVIKAKLGFKKIHNLQNNDTSKLGDLLRSFVVAQIKKGNIPFPESRCMMHAMVKDSFHGEVSCLIKPEEIQ